MIKKEQLRIGNWVCHNHSLGMKLTASITQGSDIDMYNEFEPIPLTKDILLEFEKIEKKADGLFILKLHFDYEIRIIEGKKGYTFWVQNTMISANIDHLHQLQNLYFALTNEELKKNEK